MPRRVAAVIATVIAAKDGHTKYKHLQRLHYSCLKVYTRNQFSLRDSSAIANWAKCSIEISRDIYVCMSSIVYGKTIQKNRIL